jgi:hypothetical protein
MVSRGYDGMMRLETPRSFGLRDALFVGAILAAVATIRMSAWGWSV